MDEDEHPMPADGRAYSREEVARRGDEIYEQTIRAQLGPGHEGDVVAIDVVSGDYAVAEEALTAAHRLRARRPDAEVWLVRIGARGLYRFGLHGRSGLR